MKEPFAYICGIKKQCIHDFLEDNDEI